MKTLSTAIGLGLGLSFGFAHAQTQGQSGQGGQNTNQANLAPTLPPADPPPKLPPGLLPIPLYKSPMFLSGDWGGSRTDLANKGLQFDLTWDNYVQGVVSGGTADAWRYGANMNAVILLDLVRMTRYPGLFKIRLEDHYGLSVNPYSGSVLPVNTEASSL